MRDAVLPAARVSWLVAAGAIAATYFYFLLFAEFALLELVRVAAPAQLRLVLAGLGLGGMAGAWWAARTFRPAAAARLLSAGFRACGVAALLALAARGPVSAGLAAAATGLALGGLTVVLAASLRSATGGRALGRCVGLGTGLAYAACNLPGVFTVPPEAQAGAAAGLAFAASFGLRRLAAAGGRASETAVGPWSLAAWIAVLLALVWMDSAAFFVIQHADDLRARTWGGASALWANAGVHLAAAVAAGELLDAGWRRGVTGIAALALAAACLILGGVLPPVVPAGWAYTAGVSLYSTVLVEYPARTGRPGYAALVFAVAGWMGSGLGIGMATDLRHVPAALVFAALAVVAAGLGASRVLVVAVGLALIAPSPGRAGPAPAGPVAPAEVARGREVYVAEGCVHCHSQYVRPRVAADVERWGPAAGGRLAEGPPLEGNRRQGPDLSAVGARRSPEWNRLHLQDPRALSPGSRMPAYRHLFAPGDGRGEELVAYLAALGADRAARRWEGIQAWTPAPGPAAAPAESGRLFARFCAPCHGPSGRGDGPLAGRLALPPPDWSRGFRRPVAAGDAGDTALVRIIRFGLPGGAMAGHETLSDPQALGLARFVRALHPGADRASFGASHP